MRKAYGGGASDSLDTECGEVLIELGFGLSYDVSIVVRMQQDPSEYHSLITCGPHFAAAALCAVCHAFVHRPVQLDRHPSLFLTAPHGATSKRIM